MTANQVCTEIRCVDIKVKKLLKVTQLTGVYGRVRECHRHHMKRKDWRSMITPQVEVVPPLTPNEPINIHVAALRICTLD